MRKNWLKFLSIDRVVAYSLILKLWQAFAGLVGIAFITRSFSQETQGYYYTFSSLIALQSFVELGMYLVVSNFSSHEWSRLKLASNGSIEGDPDALSRLVSLGRFVTIWYGVAALIFLVIAELGGYWFLSLAPAIEVDWRVPWATHVIFSSILLWGMPLLSLLEGCNQYLSVTIFRLGQAIVCNLAFWVAIASGVGLWAAPTLSAVSALFTIYYLLVTKRNFFAPFFRAPRSKRINWRFEILPMQWRLALQGMVSYLVFSLFTPIMFYYHGPILAGQMGMTWQIVTAIQSIAAIWILTKTPRFGHLIAKREFDVLDREWGRATIISITVAIIGTMIATSLVYLLMELHLDISERVLKPLPFMLLAGGAIFSMPSQCFAVYLRAHKKEALMTVSLIASPLLGVMIWQFGMHFGALGAAGSYLIVMSCVAFPMALVVWKRARSEWHSGLI